MAPPVYSTRFIGLIIPGIGHTGYTVPDGHLAIVRDISGHILSSDTEVNDYVLAFIQDLDGNTPIFAQWEMAAGASGPTQWEGRVVVNTGETIRTDVNTPGTVWSVTVSGYLLVLP